MAERTLSAAIGETLDALKRALDRITAGEGAEAELHNVRVYLLNILDLVERDPGVEAASDDLFTVAKELTGGTDRGTRMTRLANESLLRFRERLASARPSAQAKHMGLV
jgi:hypothetical protein